MLKKVSIKDYKNLYRNHISKDFPSNERPSFKGLRRRMKKHNEKVLCFEEEGIQKAYIIYNEIEEYIFITYLAVFKETRGEGIGTKLLQEIKQKFKDKKAIILEVEDPEKAEEAEVKKAREKRIKFYQKAEYQIVNKLKLKMFFVDYRVMILPLKKENINPQEVATIIMEFYDKVTPKKYRKLREYKIED